MQYSEPQIRHFLQITLCNKDSHFSIVKKNKTSKHKCTQFQSGFQKSVSFTIFKGQDQNLSQRKSDRWPDTIWQFNDPSVQMWHLLTNGWMTSGIEVIRCYILATLQSQPLWSVRYFPIFQKNETHTVFQRKQKVTHQNMDIKMQVNCMTLH
jgi:hypothetical protein